MSTVADRRDRAASAEMSGAPRTPLSRISSTVRPAELTACDAIAAHLAQHAERVQDGLVDAVGRQIAEAVEVRLVLEEERPRDGAEQVHAAQVGQLVGARDLQGRVGREHRAVAVAVLRIVS